MYEKKCEECETTEEVAFRDYGDQYGSGFGGAKYLCVPCCEKLDKEFGIIERRVAIAGIFLCFVAPILFIVMVAISATI